MRKEEDMDKIQRFLWMSILFLFMAAPVAFAEQEEQGEAVVLVGHISYVEGELLRYVPDEEDWVVTVKDTPVGKDDVFSSGEEGKAEFIMPNNTWIRIGGNTEIQIVTLEEDTTEVDMDSGIARFYNRSSTTALKVITPFGHVTAPPHTTFDVNLDDESAEVVALQGEVNFAHVTDDAKHEVIAGSSSLIAGHQEITSGKGEPDGDWNAWNVKRVALWEKRSEKEGDSAKYLPERLRYESYALDEHGAWESVHYEGSYRYFWRPTYVSSGWRPFSVGRWTMWYGDQCWVPYEPFGYITHHYGNWVYMKSRHRWYWAPPVHRVRIGVGPFLSIGFGWYPGRVSWIYRGGYIGWIPLAPYERYYCNRYWGPRSWLYRRGRRGRHRINIRDWYYRDHAVIVKRKHFYGVDNYNKFRIRNIGSDFIAGSYRGAPVINGRVIKGVKKMKSRFNFRSIEARRKPHSPFIKNIRRGKTDGREFLQERGTRIQRRAAKAPYGTGVKRTPVKRPRGTGKVISGRGIKKPGTIRSKRGLYKAPKSVVRKARPGTGSRGPVLGRTPETKRQRFRPGPQRSRRGIKQGSKPRSFTPGPSVKRSMPKASPRMKGRSFSPRPKAQRAPGRSRGGRRGL
jgi:hypothetical protein